jgi:hypothetical protein
LALVILWLGLCTCGRAEEPSAPAVEPADEAVARITGSLEAWGYANHNQLQNPSVLNPGNAIAHLPHDQALMDVRFNLRAELGDFQALGSARWVEQRGEVRLYGASDSAGSQFSGQLGQGFVRYRVGDDVLTAGRELLTWGPANFRSPSNPYYFDAGRTNPLAATPGIDLVRYTASRGSWRWTGAYITSTDQLSPPSSLGHSTLIKLDQQGASHLVSLIASQQRAGSGFLGGFAQITPDDAWLLYAEFGSGQQAQALIPNLTASGQQPLYQSTRPAPRTWDGLLGASYTLENGQVLIVEALHNNSGYTAAGEAAYFRQAVQAGQWLGGNPSAALGSLGQAAGQAPRLLGRNYLWLGWQSNPQDSKLFWRTELSNNLGDGSAQALVYVEKNFVPSLSGFVSLVHAFGSAQSEWGSFIRSRMTVGFKLFAW